MELSQIVYVLWGGEWENGGKGTLVGSTAKKKECLDVTPPFGRF